MSSTWKDLDNSYWTSQKKVRVASEKLSDLCVMVVAGDDDLSIFEEHTTI